MQNGMKIEFTSSALLQIKLILEMNLSATGFIQGCDIGKYKIVKSLFPIGFNKNNIDTLYHNIYEKIGDRHLSLWVR